MLLIPVFLRLHQAPLLPPQVSSLRLNATSDFQDRDEFEMTGSNSLEINLLNIHNDYS